MGSSEFEAFEKMKCIFFIAPVESLEKSREYFSLENTHQRLAVEASDAGPASGVLLVSGAGENVHRSVRWVSVRRDSNTVPTSDGV